MIVTSRAESPAIAPEPASGYLAPIQSPLANTIVPHVVLSYALLTPTSIAWFAGETNSLQAIGVHRLLDIRPVMRIARSTPPAVGNCPSGYSYWRVAPLWAILLAICVVILSVDNVVTAQSNNADQRKEVMRNMARLMNRLAPLGTGARPVAPADIEQADQFLSLSRQVPVALPAKPDFHAWGSAEDSAVTFKQKQDSLIKEVTALRKSILAANQAQIDSAMTKVGIVCHGCHDQFRPWARRQ